MTEDYTPEQDELLTVIEAAHREAWTDATEYADAPHSIRAAVVRWLAEHDREVKADAWDEGHAEGETYGAQVAEFGIGYAMPVENPYREVSK